MGTHAVAMRLLILLAILCCLASPALCAPRNVRNDEKSDQDLKKAKKIKNKVEFVLDLWENREKYRKEAERLYSKTNHYRESRRDLQRMRAGPHYQSSAYGGNLFADFQGRGHHFG